MKWFYQTDIVKLRNNNFKYNRSITSLVTNISPKCLSIDDPNLVDSVPKLLKSKRI